MVSIPSPSPTSVIFMDGAMVTKWKTFPFNFSSESAQWPQEKTAIFFPTKIKINPLCVCVGGFPLNEGTNRPHRAKQSACFHSSQRLQQVISQIGTPSTAEEKWITWFTPRFDWKNQQTPSRSKQMVAPHPQYKVDYWTRGQIQCRTEQGNLFLREETEANTSVQPWVDVFM